jgi:gluconate 2-dehydrogenase gamma chain
MMALPEVVAAQEYARGAAKSARPPRLQYLDEATAKEIESLAGRILPSDDGPGAREAGVLFFIDRALVTFDKDKQDVYRDGIAAAQNARRGLFPGSRSIAELKPAEQDRLLRSLERTDFFQVLRLHTLAGFLGNASYGGNRDLVGWKYVGFDGKMAYKPPFGYYDREALAQAGVERNK